MVLIGYGPDVPVELGFIGGRMIAGSIWGGCSPQAQPAATLCDGTRHRSGRGRFRMRTDDVRTSRYQMEFLFTLKSLADGPKASFGMSL
jgi:hypothetical protein